MSQFIVLLDNGSEQFAYGPTEDEDTARDFAKFLSATVDPAIVVPLRSPEKELLAHWKYHEENK